MNMIPAQQDTFAAFAKEDGSIVFYPLLAWLEDDRRLVPVVLDGDVGRSLYEFRMANKTLSFTEIIGPSQGDPGAVVEFLEEIATQLSDLVHLVTEKRT